MTSLENFKKDFNNAIAIAYLDKNVGVMSAIIQLEHDFGFDCSYYWDTMDKVGDGDIDDSIFENGIEEEPGDTFIECTNLCIRDRLYRRLGIYEIMDKAYEEAAEDY